MFLITLILAFMIKYILRRMEHFSTAEKEEAGI
jgi:hypothetical protein